MAFQVQYVQCQEVTAETKKINTTGTCHIFALFVHTLSFSATIVFDIDTVQMHNSTTDTIKDTYYFFKVNTADFNNLHVWFFFSFAKHKYVCPPFKPSVSNRQVFFTGRDPLTQRSVWKSMASHFPSVVGNFCKVMTSGEVGHCQHLFPIMPRSSVIIWVSQSNQLLSYVFFPQLCSHTGWILAIL